MDETTVTKLEEIVEVLRPTAGGQWCETNLTPSNLGQTYAELITELQEDSDELGSGWRWRLRSRIVTTTTTPWVIYPDDQEG